MRLIKFHLIMLAVLYFFAVFWNLGRNSFRDLDESIFVQASKEMSRSGDFMTMHVRGVPFFHKQPLKILLDSLTFALFGANEFNARFWSAVAGFGTILIVYFFSGNMYGTACGFFSSLILLFSNQFIFERCARSSEEDAIFIFFTCCIFYCFWLSRKNKSFIYLCCAISGLAFMTKGFALLIPCLPLAVFSIFNERIDRKHIFTWLRASLIFIAIVFPWHLYQYMISGKNFLKIYLGEMAYFFKPALLAGRNFFTAFLTADVVERIGHGGQVSPFINWAYYLYVIAVGFFPWSLILPFALVYLLSQNFSKSAGSSSEERKGNWLLIYWLLVPLVCLSLLYIKRTWRLNPVYPAMAIITGKVWTDLLEGNKKWAYAGALVSFIALCIFEPNQYGVPFYTLFPWLEYRLNFMLLPNRTLFFFDIRPVWLICAVSLLTFSAYLIFKKRDAAKKGLAWGFALYYLFTAAATTFCLSFKSTYRSDMHIMSEKINKMKLYDGYDLLVFDDALFRMKFSQIKAEFPSASDHWSDFYYLNNIGNLNLILLKENKDDMRREIALRNSPPYLILLDKDIFDELERDKIFSQRFRVVSRQGKFLLLYVPKGQV